MDFFTDKDKRPDGGPDGAGSKRPDRGRADNTVTPVRADLEAYTVPSDNSVFLTACAAIAPVDEEIRALKLEAIHLATALMDDTIIMAGARAGRAHLDQAAEPPPSPMQTLRRQMAHHHPTGRNPHEHQE